MPKFKFGDIIVSESANMYPNLEIIKYVNLHYEVKHVNTDFKSSYSAEFIDKNFKLSLSTKLKDL